MTDFVRIGNRILNVAHVVSVEFVLKIPAISGPDDQRVIAGRAQWDERRKGWIDDEGDLILARPSRLIITTSDMVATSDRITAYGCEAEAVMHWFALRAEWPVTAEDLEAARV